MVNDMFNQNYLARFSVFWGLLHVTIQHSVVAMAWPTQALIFWKWPVKLCLKMWGHFCSMKHLNWNYIWDYHSFHLLPVNLVFYSRFPDLSDTGSPGIEGDMFYEENGPHGGCARRWSFNLLKKGSDTRSNQFARVAAGRAHTVLLTCDGHAATHVCTAL